MLETIRARAGAAAAAAAIEPPAIVAVGEVVELRRRLDWLGALADRTPLPAR
jgi:uroporphyrin-III C-methyltransferase